MKRLPLENIRVIELGQLIAGPVAAKILGDFGADVIKVEPPGVGDPLRTWRHMHDGTSLWWQVQSRNKRSVTIDLRSADGQAIVRTLLSEADVLIENFRPGTLEQWNLSPDILREINPGLVILRVSGYGQTGPYRDRPGFGAIGEAMGGLRHLTGEPGRPPVRVGLSLGDTLAGLHGVIGVLIALYHRDLAKAPGQVVDVALYEAVFNVTESLLTEYSSGGIIRQPAGSALPGIVPSDAYRCRDGEYVLIAGNGDSIFRRLMSSMGRPELADDPRLANNDGRVANVAEIDEAISKWTGSRDAADVITALDAASVPVGRVYTAADIAADSHYRAREMIVNVTLPNGEVIEVPGIVPKLSDTPGAIRQRAPALGENTAAVLAELGIDQTEQRSLADRKII